MNYQDFDLLIDRAGESLRAQVMSSPAGQATAEFRLPFSGNDLENFLLRMGGRARSGTIRRVESQEMSAVKAFGAALFSAVFSGDVKACLRSSLGEARRQGAGLRIRLRLADPSVVDLPWEYLYNPAVNRFLALSVLTPVVRYIDVPERIQPVSVAPPIRVLVMISSPTDFPALDVEAEWTRLNEALADLISKDQIAIERLEDATLETLQRRLSRERYHVFHFIGHGGFDGSSQEGGLILERDRGREHRVDSQSLGMVLHNHETLRVAILNAREGARTSRTDPFARSAQNLVQQGIPAVIAMQFEIADDVASRFAHEFYGALADGYPVDVSMTEARKAIFAARHEVEWGTPVLYLRVPDGRVFDIESVASPKSLSVPPVLESSRHPEQDRITQEVVAAARAAFAGGRRAEAIDMLRRYDPAKDAVAQALRELTQEQQRIAEEEQRQLKTAIQEHLTAANQLLNAGNLREAWGRACDAIQLDPSHPPSVTLEKRIRLLLDEQVARDQAGELEQALRNQEEQAREMAREQQRAEEEQQRLAAKRQRVEEEQRQVAEQQQVEQRRQRDLHEALHRIDACISRHKLEEAEAVLQYARETFGTDARFSELRKRLLVARRTMEAAQAARAALEQARQLAAAGNHAAALALLESFEPHDANADAAVEALRRDVETTRRQVLEQAAREQAAHEKSRVPPAQVLLEPSEASSAPSGEGLGSLLRRWWSRAGKRVDKVANKPVAAPGASAPSDVVHCTVFSPLEIAGGQPFLVQVTAHVPEQAPAANGLATDTDPQAKPRVRTVLPSVIPHVSRLAFCLSMPGVEVIDTVKTLIWKRISESVQFEVRVPRECTASRLIGTVTVSQDGIPFGHVKFVVAVSSGDLRKPVGHTSTDWKRYQHAFVSYAAADRAEVLKRVQMLARVSIDFFQDLLTFEPGERWESGLYKQIDRSDVFFLFWSTAARNSEWVAKEIDYALRRKGGDELAAPEIVPIMIEGPPPVPPPPALRHMHFNDPFLYFIQSDAPRSGR